VLGNRRGLEFLLSHVMKYVADRIGYGVFEMLADLVNLICIDCRARSLFVVALDHCAIAALLGAGGVGERREAPRSHEQIIEHYGHLLASEPGYLDETA
jgi:hypothetical protein